jgi:uncharacterized protein (TIGR02757 family)
MKPIQSKSNKCAFFSKGRFPKECRSVLEAIYTSYTKEELIHPDPVEFPRRYENLADREVTALIASSLAYGRVQQILKSVTKVLVPLGDSPAAFLRAANKEQLTSLYGSFKHRFTTGEELVTFLNGIGKLLRCYERLEFCLEEALLEGKDPLRGIINFAEKLKSAAGHGSLLASPVQGSACKRFFLFLKWMTRKDEVDPGGWQVLSPADLFVPVDTHMHRIALSLGLTRRKQADFKTVLEITDAFRTIAPDDPVRYDFALTRFGIRAELDISELVELCQGSPLKEE